MKENIFTSQIFSADIFLSLAYRAWKLNEIFFGDFHWKLYVAQSIERDTRNRDVVSSIPDSTLCFFFYQPYNWTNIVYEKKG